MWFSALWFIVLSVAGAASLGEEAARTGSGMTLQTLEEKGLQRIEPADMSEGGTWTIEGATVFTATGERFETGHVTVVDGNILSVGPESNGSEQRATVIDGSGLFVTPGLIDTHSHLGVYPAPGARAHSDGNEATAPTTPGVWAEHSFWPQDPGLYRAIAGGVTTLHALPGSANLIGGRGVTLEVVPARGSRAMRFAGAPETIKMACGENPKRVYGDRGGPSTRMGNLRGQREAYLKAQEYLAKWDEYEASLGGSEGGKRGRKSPVKNRPTRDLDMETLVGVLEGRILPQIHCYRADDMLSMMQLADEFGFRVRSFHHALEAYKIRDVLAEHEVSVSTWADWWGFKMEAYDGIQQNAALVHEAGGIAIIHSDSAVGIQRLNQEAAKAYYAGLQAGIALDEHDALSWITSNAAWALGIEELTGTLETGKRGDVVLWSGHPLEVTSRPLRVWVNGVERYNREREDAWSDVLIGQGVQP